MKKQDDKKELSGIRKKIRTAKRIVKVSKKGASAAKVLLDAGVKLAPVVSGIRQVRSKKK